MFDFLALDLAPAHIIGGIAASVAGTATGTFVIMKFVQGLQKEAPTIGKEMADQLYGDVVANTSANLRAAVNTEIVRFTNDPAGAQATVTQVIDHVFLQLFPKYNATIQQVAALVGDVTYAVEAGLRTDASEPTLPPPALPVTAPRQAQQVQADPEASVPQSL